MNTIDKPTLTIAIPTFNRCRYLKELIPALLEQIKPINKFKFTVEILVSNNCSSDETNEFIQPFSDLGLISYRKNKVNIGAERNIMRCIEEASGEYIWIFGDDELIHPNGILTTCDLILKYKSDLIILNDGNYDTKLSADTAFNSLSDFVSKMSQINPHFLLAHTLITLNVFKKSRYNFQAAREFLDTDYSQMYGLMIGLINSPSVANAVYVSTAPVVKIRETRAQLEISYSRLVKNQMRYMRFIGTSLNNKRLYRYATQFYFLEVFRYLLNKFTAICGHIPFARKIYRALKNKG